MEDWILRLIVVEGGRFEIDCSGRLENWKLDDWEFGD